MLSTVLSDVNIREAGSLAELARRAETNPIYLSQLRSQAATPKGTKRGIGDRLARRLEAAHRPASALAAP